MKNRAKGLILISALSISALSISNTIYAYSDCIEFIAGIDYYQAWRKTRDNLHLIVPKNFPGGTIYVGARNQYLGLELGYDRSIHVKKNWTIPRGTTLGNYTFPADYSATSDGTFQGVHLDLQSFLPLDCNKRLELFGAIGIGTAGLRLGAGANYMLTDYLGLRVKVGYENNSNIRITYKTPLNTIGLNRRPFTHAGTLSAGAFFKF